MDISTVCYLISAAAFLNACRLIYRKREDEAARRNYAMYQHGRSHGAQIAHKHSERAGHKRAAEVEWHG
jgi:hypothetical protein